MVRSKNTHVKISLNIMKPKFFAIFLLIFCFSACAKLPAKATPKKDLGDVIFKAQRTDPGSTLEGGLVIQPFRSGEGVPASLETDQASLMMIKGFTEDMAQKKSAINVIIDNNTSKARFFIKGYITKYERSEGLVDYASKKMNVFAVEGKMVNLENNQIVAVFSASVQSIEKIDFNDSAYKIGQRLAAYLIEQSSGSL